MMCRPKLSQPESKALLMRLFFHLNLKNILRLPLLQYCLPCCPWLPAAAAFSPHQAPTGDASESCFPVIYSAASCCSSLELLLLLGGEYR